MQWWHGSRLDIATKARPHDELRPVPELRHEGTDFAKIIGAIAITHDDPFATNERKTVDVGSSKTPLRGSKHARPLGEGDVRGAIRRTVDNQNFSEHSRFVETFFAPVDEVPNGEF